MLWKFHFPIEFVFNSLQTQEVLELVIRSQFSQNFWPSFFFFLEFEINWSNVIIQQNVFFVLCLVILWRYETWISKIIRFYFLENERAFEVKEKTFFQVSQMPIFRLQKETSKINRAQPLKWSRCKKKMYINTYTHLFYNKKITYVTSKNPYSKN